MGTEIERKFLVNGKKWKEGSDGISYRQGYLSTGEECVVRVRIVADQAYLTIKGRNVGLTRMEFEYPIPVNDGHTLLDKLCGKLIIEKTRYKVEYRGLIWEIDEFRRENEGLVIAEVELEDENQAVPLPDWVDEDVSQDIRYYNSNLVKYPFSKWARTK